MDRRVAGKLELFFRSFKLQRFKKGDTIIRDGDPLHHIYYIRNGFVRMYILSHSGHELSLFIYSQSMFFPTLMGVSKADSTYYFEAKSDVTTYAVPAEEFTKFIRKTPEVLYDLATRACTLAHRFLHQMEVSCSEPPYIRTITVLSYIYNVYKNALHKTNPELPVSHQELSTWTHTTRETVSRQIELLVRKKIVRCTKGKLKILNIDRLRKEM
jgi:CRP-like cAMP-binding protein